MLLALVAAATGIAYRGRETVYAGEEWDWKKEPYFAVMLRGMKDGVSPWEAFTERETASAQDETLQALLEQAQAAAAQNGAEQAGDAAQNGAAGEADGGTAAGSGDVSGNHAADGNGNGADVSGNDVSGNDVSGNHAGDVSGNDVSGNSGAGDGSGSAGEDGAGGNGGEAGQSGAAGESAGNAQSGGETLTEEQKKKQENETYVYAASMPEGVNNAVVPAKDYGNVDCRFLAPDGTVYNTDTAGLFAQNGDYYRFRSVDEAYFSDAIFIGDSRTAGLYDYGDLDNTTFLAKESLSVFNMYDKKLPFHTPGQSAGQKTVLEALMERQYRKVYLSVGVNELGIPDTREYYQKYREAVAVIRQLQPDAIIYIQGIMHVSADKSRSDSVFNNPNIVQRNQAIATLANGRDIFYIDMNTAVCDENGDLKAELTADGVHLKASAYALWREFLMQNAVVRDQNDYLGTGPVEGGVDLSALGQ